MMTERHIRDLEIWQFKLRVYERKLSIKRLSKVTDYTTSWGLYLFNQIQLIKNNESFKMKKIPTPKR